MVYLLTKEQSKLILQMWKKDDFDWLYKMGTSIYSRIFELNPETKKLFPYVIEAEKAGKDVRDSAGFKRQALRFVQALSGILTAIDDPGTRDLSDVKRKLRSIGYRHQAFKAEKRFDPGMWRIFEKALVFVMEKEFAQCCKLNDDEKTSAIAGWRIVANFIITQMEIGFYSTTAGTFPNSRNGANSSNKIETVDSNNGCCHS